MFKWFAPLLLFAGKPVYLLSNIALTLDALKNPYIVAAYGVVLLCLFVSVGTVVWLRLRRRPSPTKAIPARSVTDAPPLPNEIVSERAERMAKQWERRDRRPATPPRLVDKAPARAEAAAVPVAPMPAKPRLRASLLVTGPAYTGKTALIAQLARASGGSTGIGETDGMVGLIDAGSIDGDVRRLSDLLARAAAADGTVFVVDQDLRAPEVAAITRFIAAGKPLYVVLNKADHFNAADRDRVLTSIRAKMPRKFAPGHVVSAAAAPSPMERQIEDTRGAVRVELRRPSSELQALTDLLGRIFPPAAGGALRFAAA
jgi:hypothetical protein